MSVEPIGIVAILIGISCLFLGNRESVVAFGIAPVFGSAAAMFFGPANILPGHVLLGFLAVGIITRRRESQALIRSLRFGKPGFWFAVLAGYGVLTAYFTPRLLAGMTMIIPLGSTIYGDTGAAVPLVSVSSNFTQSVYLVGDLLCFGMTVAIASSEAGFLAVLSGMIGYCVANIVFAFLDIATFTTGTQFLLSFMRNAQYVLHTDDQVAGVKRIVGSFTEASAFARSTLGVFAFCGTLWLCGRRPVLTGLIALVALGLVIFSTSSTGLVGAPVIVVVLFATAIGVSGRRWNSKFATVAIVFLPLIGVAIALWIAIDPALSKLVYNYIDVIVLGKSTSDSGVERNSWNVIALQNFSDSFGLGVGLGTVRTSSFLIALLANVGVPGTFVYGCFAYGAFVRKRGIRGSLTADARLAARNGCLGLLAGDMLASPGLDQGLFFCILAGLASSAPERSTSDVRAAPSQGITA
jgi:hypothetical protein